MDKERDSSVLSVVLTGYGGFDKIQVQSLPYPNHPKENEILVQVKTCGLNFADVYTRQGLVRDKQLPFVLGLECAGIILCAGSKVGNFKEGDHVICHGAGLQCEVVCVDASCCFLMPDNMNWESAAAFAVNYLTAYFVLFDIANLRSLQTVLIPSAAGGVGWAATQLAKTIPDVKVIGLAAPSKFNEIYKNGVDVAIDSMDPNWDTAIRSLFPEGVDIALDFTSGDNFRRTQEIVKDLGRAILIGANDMIQGETLSMFQILRTWWNTAVIKPVDLIVNSRTVSGFHLNNVKDRLPHRYRQAMQFLLELYNRRAIEGPRIDSVYPFNQIVEASKRLSERKNIGKVILTPT